MATNNGINNKVVVGDFTVSSGNVVLTAQTGVVSIAGNTMLSSPSSSTIYLGGAGNSTANTSNIGIGPFALSFIDGTASYNIGIGTNAGQQFSGASVGNIAIGLSSFNMTTVAVSENIAIGTSTIQAISGNNNIAIGFQAGLNLAGVASENILIGHGAGSAYTTTESDNLIIGNAGVIGESGFIRIGDDSNQSNCYIAAISGGGGSTDPVFVDADGLLGTAVSSIKAKDDVVDIGDRSSVLSQLRPVSFTYKRAKTKRIEFGMIAEEVDKVCPDLVNYNEDGSPRNVRYHHLVPMLVNELQKALKRIEVLEAKVK